jgi:hypothetical protein
MYKLYAYKVYSMFVLLSESVLIGSYGEKLKEGLSIFFNFSLQWFIVLLKKSLVSLSLFQGTLLFLRLL